MSNDSLHNEDLKWLLERCVHRDQAAFKSLYDQTSSRLYSVLFSILRIEAVAEDALQETYVKVWDKAGEYQAELSQPITWMTSIARYHALDLLRKRSIREDKETELDAVPALDTILADPDPSQLAEYQDILDKCFEQLSEEQRSCIARAFLEGLTHDELSVSVNRPVGTIKSWIRRGLSALKECINEHS